MPALCACRSQAIERSGFAFGIWKNVGANDVRIESGDLGNDHHAIGGNHAPGIECLALNA
jgi:hypothetical protein